MLYRNLRRLFAVSICLSLPIAAGFLRVCAQSPPAVPTSDIAAPDPYALIQAVRANQKQIEATRRDYIFRRRDEDQHVDSEGRVKSTEVKEYEVHFVANREIERLVSKDGKPLNERETRQQDEEVRKQEAKAREDSAKQDEGEEPGKDTLTLTKFLAANRFYHLRRETYQGREVYAMDFEPRADFDAHSLVEKLLKSLGGTVWIDEQARQIVRLQARFLKAFKVGGGLLGSVREGGNVVFEQRFVNREIWMPSFGEIHLDARVLLRHKPINGTSTFSDYQKFRVESKITGGTEEVPAPKP